MSDQEADDSRTPGECVTLGGHVYERDNRCFHCGKEAPPGPPGPPRCRECRRVVGYRGHAPECSIGQEQQVHFGNVAAVEKALREAVAAKRQDREFMARLRANVEKNADLLERLAESEHRHVWRDGDDRSYVVCDCGKRSEADRTVRQRVTLQSDTDERPTP